MDELIFLMAGRTGGPLTPLLAISSQLPLKPVIVGVSHGYEKKIASTKNTIFLALPETKLSALSFGSFTLKSLLDLPLQVIKLFFALIMSGYYLLRFRPKAILGAGGFTSVPMVISCRILRLFGLPTKIIIHQQDPLIGLTNRLALRLCDYGSYVYDYPKNNPLLQKLTQIPNPIEMEVFHDQYQNQLLSKYPDLANFISAKTKPILLIFGGGSGAQIINKWVIDNHAILLKKFDVIHLTGALQEKPLPLINHPRYLRFEFLLEEMPLVMRQSDIVMCRAGLGSISELLYIQKNAYLIPIKDSHQEINALMVKDFFEILEQDNIDNWLNTLSDATPTVFHNKQKYPGNEYQTKLFDYYDQLESFLELD